MRFLSYRRLIKKNFLFSLLIFFSLLISTNLVSAIIPDVQQKSYFSGLLIFIQPILQIPFLLLLLIRLTRRRHVALTG